MKKECKKGLEDFEDLKLEDDQQKQIKGGEDGVTDDIILI